MTSAEIRQDFLNFFREQRHTIVPSAPLLPQSPGLLFTNAGMNQFVPYFLGEQTAPYTPPRAADTQKCIRAGGKHNDLEDVGYDTYHHTFFEMLGNWSFGDYFKKEAIHWAWQLLVERWGFPPQRLYATVYAPAKGDPSHFDQEAYDLWAEKFAAQGLDPNTHIVPGNVKDNFWMMGDTGPCGPCSELHIDLTPNGDTKGKLVNADSHLCIEIWNLVFIQYNAEPDGSFRNLPAKHVDTGMGFERVVSILQNTKNFTDFSHHPTNYNTDIFHPYFQKLQTLSGKNYHDIYPSTPNTDPTLLQHAIAFRVLADHIRTLGLSIADGILPGNNGRNYVLRRILRRAVRYGRKLGFTGQQLLLPELVTPLTQQLGPAYPELLAKAESIKATLAREEESFNQTLDRGLNLFEHVAQPLQKDQTQTAFPPTEAFKLYDTFGFPLDLTALLCRERGLTLDQHAVETLLEKQRKRARQAQKTETIAALDLKSNATTHFLGFDQDECQATILELHPTNDKLLVITDQTPFYAEMGGQIADQGELWCRHGEYLISGVQQIGNARGHLIPPQAQINVGDRVTLKLHPKRRRQIEAHHTATHLLHWALHQIVSPDATQQGSLVTPNRLRFDFSSAPLSPKQIQQIEEQVNQRIQAADPVSSRQLPYQEAQKRRDINAFFGDKYGDTVRVVQIGGQPGKLNGYSMELCGGTHVQNTSQIGPFIIKSESAIAAGIRRIEAAVGPAATAYLAEQTAQLQAELAQAQTKLTAVQKNLENAGQPTLPNPPQADPSNLTSLQKTLETTNKTTAQGEKLLKKTQAANAARLAHNLLTQLEEAGKLNANLIQDYQGPPNLLPELLNGLKKRQYPHAALLIVDDGHKLHLGSICGPTALTSGLAAGKIISQIAPLAGGKGGGKPDFARGAAPHRPQKQKLQQKAATLLTPNQ